MQFPLRDLTNQSISTSYKDVVQRYDSGSNSYLLDGLGYSIVGIPSSSVGGIVLTQDQTASWANYSVFSDTSSFSIDSEFSNTASLSVYSAEALSSSYALTASYAVSASYEISYEMSSSYADTASWSDNSTSSSYLSGSNAIVETLTVTGLLNATQISGSQIYITSSQLTVTSNILTLNALSPHLRYAGIEMWDSGSSDNMSSILWDGTNNYFFVSSSDAGYSRKLVTGPDSEGDLTNGYIPMITSSNGLKDSVIFQSGSNVGIGTTSPVNKLDVVGNISCSVITASIVYGSSNSSLQLLALTPTQQVSSSNGNNIIISASNAVLGSGSVTPAVIGGSITLRAGSISGSTNSVLNHAGGSINLIGGNCSGNGGVAGSINLTAGTIDNGAIPQTAGDVNLTSGAGGNITISCGLNSLSRVNGTLTIQGGGNSGGAVSAYRDGGAINILTRAGQLISGGGFLTGSSGGPLSISTANGGTNSVVNTKGGSGGILTISVGNGSSGTNRGGSGGDGGSLTLNGGLGGNISGNVTGSLLGGVGSLISILGGYGGNITSTGTGNITGSAGRGSNIVITSGGGGNASGSDGLKYGGNSGNIQFNIGTPGSGSASNGTSGSFQFFGGNVGIGTISPVNKLDVVGNISCSVVTASLFYGTASLSNTASYAVSASYLSGSNAYVTNAYINEGIITNVITDTISFNAGNITIINETNDSNVVIPVGGLSLDCDNQNAGFHVAGTTGNLTCPIVYADLVGTASLANTASYALTALSSDFAILAGNCLFTSSYAATASISITASYNNGFKSNTSIKTSDYTLTATDYMIISSGSNLVMTLPPANNGQVYKIKNVHTTPMTVTSSVLIDGSYNWIINQWSTLEVVAGATQYYIT